MYSHFISYLGFCSREKDQIHNGATLYIGYRVLSIPFLLMLWRLEEPGHWRLKEPGYQQVWYWPNKLEYSISSTKRVNSVRPAQNIHHHWLIDSLILLQGLWRTKPLHPKKPVSWIWGDLCVFKERCGTKVRKRYTQHILSLVDTAWKHHKYSYFYIAARVWGQHWHT